MPPCLYSVLTAIKLYIGQLAEKHQLSYQLNNCNNSCKANIPPQRLTLINAYYDSEMVPSLHGKDCIAQDTEEAFPINCNLLFLTMTKILYENCTASDLL